MTLRFALIVTAFLLASCVTEQIGDARIQTPANLGEAAQINTQLGVDYARQGQFDVAQEKLRKAIEQDERYAPARTAMAYVLTQTGDAEGAEREYRKALSLDPSDAGTHNNFGVFLCSRGNTAEADKEFRIALADRNYGTPAAAWTNAGVCAEKAGDVARAEENFREALKLDPEFPDALARIAVLTARKGDWLRTRAFLQRYERGSTFSPELLLVAARTERALGDEVAARRHEQKLLRDFPESDQAVQLQKKPAAQ